MQSRLTLARISGIPVRTGWSTILIGGLITWSLATSIIPWSAPDASADQAWIGGLLGSVLFLGSLLAHELGHALTARRRGIEVDEVSLWIFGGIAALRSEPRSPRDEAMVAAAGPAVSAMVAIAAFLGAVATSFVDLPVTTTVLGWLAATNALLTAFNLLPGLPLDGGRLLHAALWAHSGDRSRSQSTAAQAGRVVGSALIAIGVVTFAWGGLGGLWTALVGWLITTSATQIRRSSTLRTHLGDATVGEAVRTTPVSVAWYEPAASLLHSAAAAPGRFVLVTGPSGWVVGLIDLATLRRVPPSALVGVQAGQIAAGVGDTQLPFVTADHPLGAALESSPTSTILAVEGGRVIGVVTADEAEHVVDRRRLIDLADRVRADEELAGVR